jgi:hypothetical protein
MSEDRRGTVVTFHSFGGGAGCSMAAANIGWILAANGLRVLVADWNFDSPGVDRYFRPFIAPEELHQSVTVTDLIRRYVWAAERGDSRPEPHARVDRAVVLRWDFPGDGCLHLMSAGRHDRNYAAGVGALDWDEFYGGLGGGRFLDALRDDMRRRYDYTLIDSRPGQGDVADICTVQLPDVLVLCYTLSDHSIDGAAEVAAAVPHQNTGRDVRILPVPTLVATTEQEKAEAGRLVARDRLAGLPNGMTEAKRDDYWAAVEVPYRPFYAFEEILATFGDRPGPGSSLLNAYTVLARYVTDGSVTALPPVDETLRRRTLTRFTRQVVVPEEEVALRYAPEDELWAEWIERLLLLAGVRVHGGPDSERSAPPDHARTLAVVSATSASTEAGLVPRDRRRTRGEFAVYVDDVPSLDVFAPSDSAFVTGVPVEDAVERILGLVGRTSTTAGIDPAKLGLRFSGKEPDVFAAPARNPRFCGRTRELRQLRAHLRTRGGASPVALCGIGGVGKSQVALEYVHRFKNAYDVVWWVDADPGDWPSNRPNASYERWLLVVDNADDVEHVSRLLPHGSAHVVLTSRSAAWQHLVRTIGVDVFERRDSQHFLRGYVPSLRPDEGGRLAASLGDLPAALAAAGQWLAETGTPVAEYIEQARRRGAADVERIFAESLRRLREDRPAGYRLLQICSVLAPEVALEVVYSDAFAAALAPVDPAVSRRPYRGLLIQALHRASLLTVDIGRGEIRVHRLLQRLVRSEMTADELGEIRHQAHRVLAALRPDADVEDPRSWPRLRMLWPHLQPCRIARCGDETARALVIDRLRYLSLRGGLEEAYALALRTAAAWTDPVAAEDGTPPRQLQRLRCVLAEVLRGLGRLEEARALGQAVLDQHGPGAADPYTVMTACGLAAHLRALGRYEAALALDRRTLAACAASLGDEHPVTLTALNSLATSHRLRGDSRTARRHDERAYAQRRRLLGEEHPRTLESAANLARDLRGLGDYAGSIGRLRMVRRRLEETLGPDATPTLIASANLGVSLRCSGRADLAGPLYEDAYERLNDHLGPDNPETLACRLSRAANLCDLGRGEAASVELVQVQLAYDEALGPRHPYALACANNRAVAAWALGDVETARSLAGEASRGLRDVLGPDHPHTLGAVMNLSALTAEAGDAPAAARLLYGQDERVARVLGGSHPDVARWRAVTSGEVAYCLLDPDPF